MEVDVYIDPTNSGLGTTKVSDAYQASLNIGDKRQPFWALNTDDDSYRDVVRIAADVGFSFSTAHNAQSIALYNDIVSNPFKFVRVKAQGENIGVSADELIQIDMAGKFDQIEKQSDENGVFGFKYTFNAQHNADMGGAYKIKVVNRLTGL